MDPSPGVPNTARNAYKGDHAVDRDEYNSRWDMIWAEGLEPGEKFDISGANKAMVALINDPERLSVHGKRVVVPGCGRGYDVAAFIKAGASEAVGLEVSALAQAAATKYLEQAVPGVEGGRVVEADFFKHCQPSEGGVAPYDIGYDYTFGCAMHPSLRSQWAASWAATICPGGELVTVVFPIDKTMDPDQGPPFPVSLELYKSLLEPVGFECFFSEPINPDLSDVRRKGREILARWRRKA